MMEDARKGSDKRMKREMKGYMKGRGTGEISEVFPITSSTITKELDYGVTFNVSLSLSLEQGRKRKDWLVIGCTKTNNKCIIEK